MIRPLAPVLLGLALLLTGCVAYDPPLAGDHAAPRYRADLLRCHKDVDSALTRKANASPTSAFAAAFASDKPEHDQMLACMAARGYALRS